MAETSAAASQPPAEKTGGVIPELDELKLCIRTIKDENPEQGIAKVHAALKAKHPDWQNFLASNEKGHVSQDRVKKILSEMVVLVDGKPKKGLVNKSDPTLSAKEIAKQKTELALAKKKEAARQKTASTVGGIAKPDTSTWRPGGDISH